MTQDTDASFTRVVDSVARGELLILAGAGVSMLAPSSLPDWKGFNRALLEEVKASALTLSGLPDAAMDAIRRIDLERLAVEAFSDAIVSSLAGDSYFPLLGVLDSDQTNANHKSIAELARRRACRAIVTTNFDTLIERAVSEIGIEVDVFAAPDDFRRNPGGARALYKIHGSATATTTLVDTVTQKLQGLSPPVRQRLFDLFNRYHVLVVGFSGADLDFGGDYLALSALKTSGTGITWIVQPGRRLRPQAEAIVRAAGGIAVEATLTEVFMRLGVPAPVTSAGPISAGQVGADARARARIGQWLKELGGGPLASLLFCIAVAGKLGWRQEEQAFRAALVADLEKRGDHLPLHALIAFKTLATLADADSDPHASDYWANRALAFWAAFKKRAGEISEPVSPAGMRQMNQHLIGIWVELGRSRAARGDMVGARELFIRAQRAAEEIQDVRQLGNVFFNNALLLQRERSSVEERLELLQRAWTLAAKEGSADGMTQAALAEAITLTTIGEYDAAVRAVTRAERVARWSGSLLTQLSPDLLRAQVAARRGHIEEAIEGFGRLVAAAVIDPVLEARIMLSAISALAFHSLFRERMITYLDCISDAMAAGRIPDDGSNENLPSKSVFKEMRSELVGAAPNGTPSFPAIQHGVPDTERGIRNAILQAEYQGDDATVTAALLQLANTRYSATKPRRMLDLAEGALDASERATASEGRSAALVTVAIARDLSGDLQGAIDACRSLLGADPPPSEEHRILASHNLALVLARIGRAAEAVPLLRAVVAYRENKGVAEHARSIIALADALARQGDTAGAIATLEQGATIVAKTDNRLAIAKRDAMLASLHAGKSCLDRSAGLPVFFARGQVSVTLDQIERHRRHIETADERVDIAALALTSGHMGIAVDLLLEAQSSFHRDGDARGLTRCFHALADAAQIDGRWDDAADLTRHALKLHEDMHDVAGQIASYAALALQFLEVQRLDGAEWAATQCLTRVVPAEVSRFTVIAGYSLAEAHRRRGHQRYARRAMKHLREELASAPDLLPGSALQTWLATKLGNSGQPAKLYALSVPRAWLDGLRQLLGRAKGH